MNKIREQNTTFSEEEKPERFLGRFIFTRRTVTYGHKTLQLSNVVKIEVKGFQEVRKATFRVSDESRNTAIRAALAGLMVLGVGYYLWDPLQLIGLLLVLAGGGVTWYYYHERSQKQDEVYNYYGLFFECTSGKTEVLWSGNKDFTFELFDRITSSMNDDRVASFVANFTEYKFENSGDVFAHNSDSTITNRSNINT
ncbi:MAG: hypothetical protein EP344_09940 [Bacteroidetes bacterium]|nr:MAG: hypothetical protein EP344_09940 [Bacteroidota bacterium]